MPGLSVNWGGGGGAGGPFNWGKYDVGDMPTASPAAPYWTNEHSSRYNPQMWGEMNRNIDLNSMSQQQQMALFQQRLKEREMALAAKYGMMRDAFGAFGATANMATNAQVVRGQSYLQPAVENARQGTITGGISNDEYDRGISDARQRIAAQGRATQGAITSALAQRGVVSPLAGMIAGLKAQFAAGGAAGAARADYDKARQGGRISYSNMLGGLAGDQARLATTPTQENAMGALQTLTGFAPKRKQFKPEYL